MTVPNLTPEESIAHTEHTMGEWGNPLPAEVNPFLSAMLLVLTEVVNGNCSCDGCTRLREIASNFMDRDIS